MFIFHRLVSIRCWLKILGIVAILGLMSPMASARDTYTLAVVPQFTPITVHRNWQPLIVALTKETGIKLKLRVYNSFNRFVGALDRGVPDFSYMAPYHLVQTRRSQKYIPLLRDETRDLIGIVVVRKDSPYQSIQDLDGKQIDFPSPSAFAASLYLRAHLHEKLKINYEARYVGNHDNVYRHVALNLADGGGGVNNTFSQQPLALQKELRVLYEVPGVASHPVAVHERVPADVIKKIQTTLLMWRNDPEKRKLLEAIQMQSPVMANYEKDYQHLESLGLERYLTEPGK